MPEKGNIVLFINSCHLYSDFTDVLIANTRRKGVSKCLQKVHVEFIAKTVCRKKVAFSKQMVQSPTPVTGFT